MPGLNNKSDVFRANPIYKTLTVDDGVGATEVIYPCSPKK